MAHDRVVRGGLVVDGTGQCRFIERAEGCRATLCNGEVVLLDDEHSGARAGVVVRS